MAASASWMNMPGCFAPTGRKGILQRPTRWRHYDGLADDTRMPYALSMTAKTPIGIRYRFFTAVSS